ncbi:MAG: hypothetical protein Q9199_003597 [Rusavskia elegans]
MSRDKGVWKAGTELEEPGTGQFEFLLAPGTQEWSKHGVHGRHFQLFFGKECYRMVLKAHRPVVVNKERVSKNDTYVLEDKDQVRLENFSYVFSYAEFAYTANGKLAFYKHMGENPALARGHCLTAPYAPTAKPIVAIGDYRCPPSSFARGGSGEVIAGWSKGGRAVAIKRLRDRDDAAVQEHVKVMKRIRHPDIVKLLGVVPYMEGTSHPDTYCIYSPLGKGTLLDVMGTHSFDFAAKCNIFRDCTGALDYLHDNMGMMHRDIKPQNIGIRDYKNPSGFIFDLDTIIKADEAFRYVGTPAWMAPEVLALEYPHVLDHLPGKIDRCYHHSVDLWALGLCMFTLENGGFPRWITFSDDPEHRRLARDNGIPDYCVTRERWEGYYLEALDKMQEVATKAGDQNLMTFIGVCQQMTRWEKDDRGTALDAFNALDLLAASCGPGTLTYKKGTKRDADEIS